MQTSFKKASKKGDHLTERTRNFGDTIIRKCTKNYVRTHQNALWANKCHTSSAELASLSCDILVRMKRKYTGYSSGVKPVKEK